MKKLLTLFFAIVAIIILVYTLFLQNVSAPNKDLIHHVKVAEPQFRTRLRGGYKILENFILAEKR